ncbi:MAG: hypothetical protein RL020_514 [Pseudomonadota bacterium]|jgi:glutaredoxin
MQKISWKLLLLLCALIGDNVSAQDNPPTAEPAVPVVEAVKQEQTTIEPPASGPVQVAAPASVQELYVPALGSGVIVYSEPRNKSSLLGLIEPGAGVAATGEEQNGYMRVQGGSITGWVDKQLLKKSSAEQIMGEEKKFANRVTRPRLAITKMVKRENSVAAATDGRVVLYSASWCPYCDKARAYMQRNGVAFDEHDTEKSAKGRRDYEAMNGDGIPIILVSNHKIVGWKQREFERHYGLSQPAPEEQREPAPVVQVARAVAPPARIISSDAGPAYMPKIASGVIVYSQPTNKSTIGGLIKGSQQVIALGEEQNGYMRVQGSTGDGWVDKSLMKKL